MTKSTLVIVGVVVLALIAVFPQAKTFPPVTQQTLENPSPNDWLMYSRTYDAQRFSPLDQINKKNVSQLRLAWERGMGAGQTETIPLVYNGIMYVINPGAVVQALDAATGDLIWEYKREMPANVASQGRTKALAIYQDVLLYTAPDSYVVGVDARTGKVRWETKTDTRGNTSGAIVVDGKVISGGACGGNRANCYIAAHDALTGKELWRFHTTPGIGEPGDESWGGAPVANRQASTWGLPGTYDPVRKLLYWGNVALDPATGKLAWYYQHLPADDWDSDFTHERTLARTKVSPDPKFVKWINPDVRRGEERDVAISIGEAGGVFALDRGTGQFLWATPFPCSYWPTAYSPATNSVYVSYIDNCRDLELPGPQGRGGWKVVPRPGSDPNALTGLARINIATGEILRFDVGRAPGNGAVLATAGSLIFHGDMNRRFRAFDAETGKQLWETILGGNISVSTITYSVSGQQYIAVMTGHNAIYVFALP